MWTTAFEFLLTTSLGFSALLCNKPPESAYSRLAQVGAGDDQEMMSSLLSDGEKLGRGNSDVENELALDRSVGLLRGMKSPEERAGFFSKLTFGWLNPLLELGVSRPLQEEDLYPLARYDTSNKLGDDLDGHWNSLVRTFKRVPCL